MGRSLSFSVRKERSYWTIFIPARHSATGKDRRLYFRTKEKALDERTRLLGLLNDGEQSCVLPRSQVDRMQALLAEVAEAGAESLREAVDEWKAARQAANRAGVTVAEMIVRFQGLNDIYDSKTIDFIAREYVSRLDPSVSPKHRKAVSKAVDDLGEAFAGVVADALDPLAFSSWLEDYGRTRSMFNYCLRLVKPVFAWAVKNRLARTNPVEHVLPKKVQKKAPDILSPEQVRSLLSSCRDWSNDTSLHDNIRVDCTDALTPVALLLFTGVRPAELERLTWQDIYLDKRILKISEDVAKTDSIRNVRLEENIHAYLSSIPVEQRTRSLVPKNWKRKWQAVRKKADIDDLQDVCRHTYASYWLAMFENMDSLLMNMGHTTSRATLKHYLTACEQADAVVFWNEDINRHG